MTTAWPGDSTTVERWVRAMISEMARDGGELTIDSLRKLSVTADLAGTDLRTLTVNASRVEIRVDPTAADSAPATAGAPVEDADDADDEPLTTQTGTLHAFRFIAHPLRVESTPIEVDVQASDVPITWQTFAEPVEPAMPGSTRVLMPQEHLEGARGSFDISVRTRDAARLLASAARPALSAEGLRLGRVNLSVTEESAHRIRVEAYAGMRWKLLAASARVAAVVEVSPDAVITLHDLVIGSRNLLVKIALRFARSHIRAAIGKSVDLNEKLAQDAAGVRIHSLRVMTGDRIGIAGRVDGA